MAFLKFFCLFKQLKTPRHCASRLGCISPPARFNFANSQKTETNAFSASEGESREHQEERRGEGMMGLGDEANGRRRHVTTFHSSPLQLAAHCSTACSDNIRGPAAARAS